MGVSSTFLACVVYKQVVLWHFFFLDSDLATTSMTMFHVLNSIPSVLEQSGE